MNMKKTQKKDRKGLFREMYGEARWMYRYTRRHWAAVCFYIMAGIFAAGMSLGTGVASKYLIDAVIGGNRGRIAPLAAVIAGLAVCNILVSGVVSRISARIRTAVQNEIQADIYDRVIHTDWESLQPFRSGDLLSRLTADAAQVASGVIGWLPSAVTKLVQFLGAFVIIFCYDPVMAGIALLSAPVTVAVSAALMGRMRGYNQEMRRLSGELMSFQNDSFQNLQTVKAFDLMGLFSQRLGQMQQVYQDKMLDYNRFSVYTSSLLSAVGMVVSYTCFGWSAYRLWSGYITPGTMLMFFQMAGALSAAFTALVQMVPAAISTATCAGRLMAVSELEKEQSVDAEQAERLLKQSGGVSVRLEGVDVNYKDGGRIITGGDFRADSGEVVAVVGPSGEGKTTLIRLLLGLIYPAAGTAGLVGANGERCRISSATRRLFGYVPQGNTIFAGTIAENLRMVKCDASEEEMVEALKVGCAYEFVEQLPQGIHTVIGEHGTGLSEGQAQRIAIARAMLTGAPILLLDEATSALDMETEKRVLKNIMDCGKHRTCIVTTHRDSILAYSSRIYEIRHNHMECVKK